MLLSRRTRTFVLPAALLSAVLAAGCRSTDTIHAVDDHDGDNHVAKEANATGAKSGDKKKDGDEKSPEDKAHEVAKKQHEIEMAKLDRDVAAMKAETGLTGARQSMIRAEQELDEAKQALEAYRTVQREITMKRTQLGLDGARGRVEDSEAELKELEAMYAEEEFAESTKEIVIRRGRRSLEFSRRGLALSEADAQFEREYEVPKKIRELERAVVKAEQGVDKARRDLEVEKMEADIATKKSTFKMEELERELAKLMEDEA